MIRLKDHYGRQMNGKAENMALESGDLVLNSGSPYVVRPCLNILTCKIEVITLSPIACGHF